MQRDEKQLEMTLNAVLTRLNDLRMAIAAMINKLETEYETINWPIFLDNFALISSHLTSLSKILSKNLCSSLKPLIVLPLLLTQDRDENLLKLTQGRLPIFSHDIVPDYLRTKPDPIAEAKMAQNEQKAANLTTEAAMKQVAQYTKVVTNISEMVSKAREEWENESSSRAGIQQTSSMTDTYVLASAIGMGKGLRPMGMPGGPGGMMVPGGPGNVQMRAPPMNTVNPGGVNQMGKAPSAIKTNIKSAMQVHQFTR